MRDKASIRLSWLCLLAGLPHDAWRDLSAIEFKRALAARAWS